MTRFTQILALSVLCACNTDETLTAYAAEGVNWSLVEINGQPFDAKAALRLGENGAVSGQAPCNSFGAELTVPYPWFELGPIRATKRACPDLAAESAFFNALSTMTLAEANGPYLFLSNTEGGQMIFITDSP